MPQPLTSFAVRGSLLIKVASALAVILGAKFAMVLFDGCDDCDSTSTYIAATQFPAAVDLERDDPSADNALRSLVDTPADTIVVGDGTDSSEVDLDQAGDGVDSESVEEDEETTPSTASADSTPAEGEASVVGDGGDGAAEDGGSTTTTVATTTTEAPTTTTAAPTTTTTKPPQQSNPGAVIGSVPVNGETFYVSARNGSDSNDGKSASSPWKSLNASLKRLQPGQTLLVMEGEYREQKDRYAHFSINHGGRADAWIRVAAHPGHNPVLIGSNTTGLQVIVPYVEVSGLTVRGEGFNKDNNFGIGIALNDTHNVRIVGNRVSSFPLSGISITESDNFDIIGNDVSGSSFWSPLQGSGISVWHAKNKGKGAGPDGYHARIIGNRVYNNENKVLSSHKNYTVKTDGNGIIVDSNIETGYSGRTLIANNVVFDNGGRGIIVWQSNKVDIVFNTSYHNGRTRDISGGATELAAGKANDVVIANNVGWARSGWPAIIFDRVSNGSSYNNVLISDSPSGHASGRDITHSGNPGLRNPTTDPNSADFRPTSGSMLKGAVRDSPRFIGVDRVGTSRTSGTPDIGAYEAEASRR